MRGVRAMKRQIFVVMGTRPEAIKLAPIVHALRARSDRFAVFVCATAQHREMLDSVLDIFQIAVDADLNVMQDNQSPSQVAAAIFAALEPLLLDVRPDWVVVQGDTTTVAIAALAAYYCGFRVAHVEAGLRTHDKWQPFPEEINRRVTGAIADLHFAPTPQARENLLRENIPPERILVTGNPVIDALHMVLRYPEPDHPVFRQIDPARRLILVTAHRRENFGEPLERICRALYTVATRFAGDVQIVYPVHMNPNVWQPVHARLGSVPNIVLVPPVDYCTLAHLMRRAYLIVTDSGGIQEEAPSLGKPVIVLREVTERPEAVRAGTVRLVGTDDIRIVAEITRLLTDAGAYATMAHAVNPYGDGHAAERIVRALAGEPVEPFRGPA